MTGSPISDLNPILMAAGTTLNLASENKSRNVLFNDQFYTGYRKTCLESNEILVSVCIPYTKENEYFIAYKQARRREDDIAIVNGAFFYQIQNGIIERARMAFGGLSFVTKMAKNTSEYLQKKPWAPDTFDTAMSVLLAEIPLPPGVPGAMVKYRQTLALSLLFKSFLSVSDTSQLHQIGNEEKSVIQTFHKEPLRGSQLYEIVPETQKEHDPLRRPLKHKSADKQVTGKK